MKYGRAGVYEWVRTPAPVGNWVTHLDKIPFQTARALIRVCIQSRILQMTLLPKGLATGSGLGGLWGRNPLDADNPPHPETGCTESPSLCLGHFDLPAENSWFSAGFWLRVRSYLRCGIRATEKQARLYYFKQKLLLNRKHSQFQNMK